MLNGDGTSASDDNCPSVANPTQDDTDDDGQGDLCEGTHERSITLSFDHVRVNGDRKLKLSGDISVADTASRCEESRRVFLERYSQNTDGWVVVGAGERIETEDGHYAYKAADVAAKYRARVRDRHAYYGGSISDCSSASTTERHNH